MNLKIILPIIVIAAIFAVVNDLKIFSHAQKPIDPNTLTGRYDPAEKVAVFHGKKFRVPQPKYPQAASLVLGESDVEKRIEVDLTNQRVYAFEDNEKIYDFLVSTGLWGRTPTGEFTIWGKYRYIKMSGGSSAIGTYYYLPNVPFTMFFYGPNASKGAGFSLHGTYWHDNFGHPMSHGCINMRTEDAEKIFYWSQPEIGLDDWSKMASAASPGTKIVIYGETPVE